MENLEELVELMEEKNIYEAIKYFDLIVKADKAYKELEKLEKKANEPIVKRKYDNKVEEALGNILDALFNKKPEITEEEKETVTALYESISSYVEALEADKDGIVMEKLADKLNELEYDPQDLYSRTQNTSALIALLELGTIAPNTNGTKKLFEVINDKFEQLDMPDFFVILESRVNSMYLRDEIKSSVTNKINKMNKAQFSRFLILTCDGMDYNVEYVKAAKAKKVEKYKDPKITYSHCFNVPIDEFSKAKGNLKYKFASIYKDRAIRKLQMDSSIKNVPDEYYEELEQDEYYKEYIKFMNSLNNQEFAYFKASKFNSSVMERVFDKDLEVEEDGKKVVYKSEKKIIEERMQSISDVDYLAFMLINAHRTFNEEYWEKFYKEGQKRNLIKDGEWCFDKELEDEVEERMDLYREINDVGKLHYLNFTYIKDSSDLSEEVVEKYKKALKLAELEIQKESSILQIGNLNDIETYQIMNIFNEKDSKAAYEKSRNSTIELDWNNKTCGLESRKSEAAENVTFEEAFDSYSMKAKFEFIKYLKGYWLGAEKTVKMLAMPVGNGVFDSVIKAGKDKGRLTRKDEQSSDEISI